MLIMWQKVSLYKGFLEVLNSVFNGELTTGIITHNNHVVVSFNCKAIVPASACCQPLV